MRYVKLHGQGFSLVEVLIVFTVMAIGLMALAKLQVFMMNEGVLTKQKSEAISFANSKIEYFRHYEALATSTGLLAYDDIVSGNDTLTRAGVTYTRSWSVTENTSLGYKDVVILVTWTSRDGVVNSVAMNHMIAKINPAVGLPVI